MSGSAPYTSDETARNEAFKSFVDGLEVEHCYYIASFDYGANYTMLIQRIPDPDHCSFIVFGYQLLSPLYFKKLAGVWSMSEL